MSWLSTIVTAFITAALGTVLSGYVATLSIRWYRISGFEGKSGYYMVAMALLGLMVGAAIGLVVSRIVAASANPGLLKSIGISLATMSALVAIVGTVGRLRADVPPTIDDEALMLMVEARWPATQTESPANTPGVSYVKLGSIVSGVMRASRKGALWKEDAHQVDGRWVVPGAVFLFTERGDRSLDVALNDSVNAGFVIRLGRRPAVADMEWSDWYPKDGRTGPTRETGVTYRYRVQKMSSPIRTEKIGEFEVAIISNGFQEEIPEGTSTLDPYASFKVKYRGKPVEFTAGGTPTDHAGALALLPSEKPGLLALVETDNANSYCALLTDEGSSFREEKLDECSGGLNAIELTNDSMRFAAISQSGPLLRGRVNRQRYAGSSLLLFQKAVLDARSLELQRMQETSASGFVPSVPPLGISPDRHSFVRYNYGPGGEHDHKLIVINYMRDTSYDLVIDAGRMRFGDFKALTPAWLMHHFQWHRGADGEDVLQVRPDFVPIPYFGVIAEEGEGRQAYRINKAGQELRLALMEHLERDYAGKREAVPVDDYQYPIVIEGRKLRVAASSDFSYVMVSPDYGEPASDIVARIAKSFNAILATGRYDALFAK